MGKIDRLLLSPHEFGITHYQWNEDGSLDVFQDVYLDLEGKLDRQIPFTFNKVEGTFRCYGVNSLVGSPRIVTKGFFCGSNDLTSLIGGPDLVGGTYDCSRNMLTSLEGSPRIVSRFNCSENKLTSLKYCPGIIRDFNCSHNLLTTLEYCPKYIDELNIGSNKIESLEDFPNLITKDLFCDDKVVLLIESHKNPTVILNGISDNSTPITQSFKNPTILISGSIIGKQIAIRQQGRPHYKIGVTS